MSSRVASIALARSGTAAKRAVAISLPSQNQKATNWR
jgi:hypothetical protein